jgi:hypothetical protein
MNRVGMGRGRRNTGEGGEEGANNITSKIGK